MTVCRGDRGRRCAVLAVGVDREVDELLDPLPGDQRGDFFGGGFSRFWIRGQDLVAEFYFFDGALNRSAQHHSG